MAHDEFPPLTRESKAVLKAATAMEYGEPERRVTAAVIREAIKQASPDRRGSCKWDRLGAIADNLHALPPPPPTQIEMNEALAILMFKTEAGQVDSLLHECVQVLQRGIAHHCKEQP